MPVQVDNIYALLAVVVMMLVPAIPGILTYLQQRSAAIKAEELKSQLIEVHSIINSGAERDRAQSHAEGRAEAQAESETNAAALAHNAERNK